MARSAGVLLSITSLPSPYGIGTIGKEARKFADFLKKSGQTIWQILPVGPTSYGDSPYQSFSTYAGNPYLIDLDTLCEEGLLTKEEVMSRDWGSDDAEVDYEKIYNNRFEVLKIAYDNFKKGDQKAFTSFKRKNSSWLKNYALYMAVKKSFDMVSWTEWPDEEIKMRDEAAVKRYERKLKDDVDFWKFVQFKFYEQWKSFRAYVNGLGIKILGDMPIYVAMDSADTWANPELFQLYDDGDPIAVAGCPPDYFSATGQLWGILSMIGITLRLPTMSGGLSVSKPHQSFMTSPVLTISELLQATIQFLILPKTQSTVNGLKVRALSSLI